jgi:hypothetical protein
MRFFRLFVLLGGLVVVVAACSRAPAPFQGNPALDELRASYLRTHPEGAFTAHVEKGEVVKGMGFVEVLAAWGLPNLRRGSEDNPTEVWEYLVKDDASGDVTVYRLVFRDRILVDWEVGHDVAANGGFRSGSRDDESVARWVLPRPDENQKKRRP